MKKTIYFALLLTASISSTLAQYKERNWEKGELTWNDFKGNALNNSEFNSKINYKISCIIDKKRINDAKYIVFSAKNFMLPSISWVKQNYMNDSQLKYNKVIFNIAELQRREMISELHRINYFSNAELEKIVLVRNQLADEKIDQFKTDSKKGENPEVINRWYDKLDEKLETYPYEIIPKYNIKNFGWGMNFGATSKIFFGQFKESFSTAFDANLIGLNFAFKKVHSSFNFGVGSNKVKKEYTDERVWPKGLETNIGWIDLNLGYSIFESPKFRVIPFLGTGFYEIYATSRNNDFFNNHTITNFTLMYGVDIEFIHRVVNLIPKNVIRIKKNQRNGKSMIEHSFRIRLFYDDGLNNSGKTFNIGFYYSSLKRKINILPKQDIFLSDL